MNASLLLGDIIRWFVAVVLMTLVIYFSGLAIFFTFEFFLTYFIKFNNFLYLLSWFILLGVFIPFFTWLTAFIASLVVLLVRQKLIFGNIFATVYIIALLAVVGFFWFGKLDFGWEQAARHHTMNKVMFSLFVLGNT